MASPAKLTLYGALLCPYVQRARTALEYLKVPYDYEEVDLATKQQQSAWYTAINPCQKVPTIKDKDNLIFESLIILEYLQEVYA
jgi:glutathione S-transferase